LQNNLESYYRRSRLIVKYWENALSEQESEELETWVAASEENKLLFEELSKEATLKDELKAMGKYHPQRAWENIEANRKPKTPWGGVIATLILLLLAITLKWCYLKG